MPDIGVYISLKNDENFILPCYEAIYNVFPQVKVFDCGSTDESISRVPDRGAVITSYDVTADNYNLIRNELSRQHKRVFWIDADEIYPESALSEIKDILTNEERFEQSARQIIGLWKNLKLTRGQLYLSSPLSKGRIAWDPSIFELKRPWPRERLVCSDPKYDRPAAKLINDRIFCYHAVILPRSRVQDNTPRRKKRAAREGEFDTMCTWTKIPNYPWLL